MWIITFIPLIVTLLVIDFLPDMVPMHYNAQGEIDRWGSKYEQLILPVVTIAMTVFMQLIIVYYEKSANKSEDEKKKMELRSNINVLYIVSSATALMFLGLQCVFLYQAWEATPDTKVQTVDINKIASIFIGILLIIGGNYMPKTKPNSLVGFRLPITMKSDKNWKRANKFGGIVLVIAGVIMIILALIFDGYMAMVSTMMVILLALVVCMMYAKWLEGHE